MLLFIRTGKELGFRGRILLKLWNNIFIIVIVGFVNYEVFFIEDYFLVRVVKRGFWG